MLFNIIGIGNQSKPEFSKEILQVIGSYTYFSGGKRHYELVKAYLPKNHQWVFITGGMDVLIEQYKTLNETVCVFASGDPLFYGFANTLQRLLPEAKINVYPYFNSIQRLCHKTETNYNDLKVVSVHGRDWSALDAILIQQEALIGVLTDTNKSPQAIAKRMLQYGFDNYKISVGEALDGDTEQIIETDLETCSQQEFQALNCVLLKRSSFKNTFLGNKDIDFEHLPNRSNMITKMPVRLTTLHYLNCNENEVLWDIGACTGSVAIEAKRNCPKAKVIAFEKRTECEDIIQINTERFSTPGIEIVIADFFELDLQQYPMPDVVFIGGHGNRLEEMILKLLELNPKVRFVTNAVLASTSQVFTSVLEKEGFKIETTEIQVNNHNKIKIHATVNP